MKAPLTRHKEKDKPEDNERSSQPGNLSQTDGKKIQIRHWILINSCFANNSALGETGGTPVHSLTDFILIHLDAQKCKNKKNRLHYLQFIWKFRFTKAKGVLYMPTNPVHIYVCSVQTYEINSMFIPLFGAL